MFEMDDGGIQKVVMKTQNEGTPWWPTFKVSQYSFLSKVRVTLVFLTDLPLDINSLTFLS